MLVKIDINFKNRVIYPIKCAIVESELKFSPAIRQGFVFLDKNAGHWKRMLSPLTTECFWYLGSFLRG